MSQLPKTLKTQPMMMRVSSACGKGFWLTRVIHVTASGNFDAADFFGISAPCTMRCDASATVYLFSAIVRERLFRTSPLLRDPARAPHCVCPCLSMRVCVCLCVSVASFDAVLGQIVTERPLADPHCLRGVFLDPACALERASDGFAFGPVQVLTEVQ